MFALPAFLGPVIDGIFKVLDKAIPDATQREQARQQILDELLKNNAELVKASRDTIVAEASGESWMQRNWRPCLMFSIMFLILYNAIVLPVLGAAFHTDLIALQHWDAIPPSMWSLLQLGVGGYVVGRSGEKIVNTYVNGAGK